MFGAIAGAVLVPWARHPARSARPSTVRGINCSSGSSCSCRVSFGGLGSRPGRRLVHPGDADLDPLLLRLLPDRDAGSGSDRTPRRLPNSITEAVLQKTKGHGAGQPAGAAAAPQTKAERGEGKEHDDDPQAIAGLAGLAVGLSVAAAGRRRGRTTPHYPLIKPVQQDWDLRGAVRPLRLGPAAARPECLQGKLRRRHSMHSVAFRNLQDLGYTDAQVRRDRAEYQIQTVRTPTARFRARGSSVRSVPVALREQGSGRGRQQRCCAA